MEINVQDLKRILNPNERDPKQEARRQATLARLRAQVVKGQQAVRMAGD